MAKRKSWIGANLEYKRTKCTVEQKALKKVVTEVAKLTNKDIKSEVGVFRDTGALGFGLGSKVIDPKKNYKYVAIVGVKNSRYSKETKKGLKTPNRYARMQNNRHEFIQRGVHGKDNLVRNLLLSVKEELIVTK